MAFIEGLDIACIQKARVEMSFKFNDFIMELKEKWPLSGHFSFNSLVKSLNLKLISLLMSC